MAHPVTAPAMQRAMRLLQQRVTPAVLVSPLDFEVHATEEWFESPGHDVATSSPLAPFTLGSKWGRPWHTRWFRLQAVVPPSLADEELVAHIDLGFIGRGDGFEVEALAWIDGRIVQAVQPDRRLVPLGRRTVGDTVEIWLEAAATPIIAGHEFGYGPTPMGDPATAPEAPIYRLRTACLAGRDAGLAELELVLHAAIDLTMDLPEHSPQRARLFAALERCGTALDVNRPRETAAAALAALRPVMSIGNGPNAHRIVATGHAHLDTAWLWPIRETRRKAVRTFANAVGLLDENPDYVYCHSQAQHYAWVAEDAPDLFARVREFVAAGRWEVVGGMWVETDLNLPDGESLLRQLVKGQAAFRGWFGSRCTGAFLPDDFGYPAGLPQIVAEGGCRWFFTQKLSWNETNRFPHHSFWWEGLDGTAVYAHFSPVDTYNAIMNPSQLRFAERNYADHAGSDSSLVLFGHGDGGGGPTREMIARARLAADLEGVPRVSMGRVDGFFTGSLATHGPVAPRWVGEMYFEKHRGTYSTQLGTKQGNRTSERLLHEVELWAAAAGRDVPVLDALWKRVLTQQFHDIIPGSSIAWVHDDAEREHREVADACEGILSDLLSPAGGGAPHAVNPASVRFTGVVDVDGSPAWADVPALAWAPVHISLPDDVAPVGVRRDPDGSLLLDNGTLKVRISADGHLASLVGHGRDVLGGRDARLVLRPDTPAEYDAWDIDRADADSPAVPVDAVGPPRVVLEDPLRVVVETELATASSRFVLRHVLDAGADRLDVVLEASWHESERRLQWVLPVDLLAREAVMGTQFGHVRRPRHANTTWDLARFETCGHRWASCAEPGFGAAILADGPRGYDVRGDALRLTVLRSPRFPDPEADRGDRRITWSVAPLPGDPVLSGIEEIAAAMACPPRVVSGAPAVAPPGIEVSIPGVLASAVKPAEDGSGDLVVRLWETRGSRTAGRLVVASRTGAELRPCNALEEPVGDAVTTHPDGGWALSLDPFRILTLRLTGP